MRSYGAFLMLFCWQVFAQVAPYDDGLELLRERATVPGGELDQVASLRYRMALLNREAYAESTAYHTSFFDGFHGTGLVESNRLMRSWKQLADAYPPALAALQQRFDRLTATLREGKGTPEDVFAVGEMAVLLGCEDEGVALMMAWLSEPATDAVVAAGAEVFFEVLAAADLYEPLGRFVYFEPRIEAVRKKHAMSRRNLGRLNSGRQAMNLPTGAEDAAVRELALIYRVLTALNRDAEAAALVDRALAIKDSPETREVLAWNAYRSGSPKPAHLALAREALAAEGGKSPRMANTVARLLLALGDRGSARELVRTVYDHADAKARLRLDETLILIGTD